MSYQAEVNTGGSDWTANACRYPSKESAERSARDLASRWMAVVDWRIVESSDPVNMSEDCTHLDTGHSAIKGAGHRVTL